MYINILIQHCYRNLPLIWTNQDWAKWYLAVRYLIIRVDIGSDNHINIIFQHCFRDIVPIYNSGEDKCAVFPIDLNFGGSFWPFTEILRVIYNDIITLEWKFQGSKCLFYESFTPIWRFLGTLMCGVYVHFVVK